MNHQSLLWNSQSMLSMMLLFFLLCSILHGGMCYIYPPPVISYSSSTHSAKALEAKFTVANQMYGNGLYTGKASSVYLPQPYEDDLFAAFDNNDATFYTEGSRNYDTCTATSCSYTGGVNSVYDGRTTTFGEWIQLTLPSPIQLNSFYIATHAKKRIATAGVMLGSNDGGSSFSLIQSFTDSNIVNAKTVPLISSVSYSTFRLVVTKTGGDWYLSIATFQLNSVESSTVAPSNSPTVAPTFSPSTSSPSTMAPTSSAPSTLIPTPVELPKCPDGWTLHSICEWTYGPEKNNIEHDAVSVDTKAEVSSNDARLGYNQFFMGVFVGTIVSLSIYLYTRSKKEIDLRSEYTRINDREIE
jgi:hypothetical protein